MEKIDITPNEIDNYTRKLIPKLARYPRGRWVPISDIAHNVGRFIQICQQLADTGAFDDEDGDLMIDIFQDSLVRLNPMYWTKKQLQNKSPYDSKVQRKKQSLI